MNNEKNNININELLAKAKENSNKTVNQGEINDFLSKNLSPSQAQAVSELLGDKEKTQKLLESDAAKALFNKFFGGKGNG